MHMIQNFFFVDHYYNFVCRPNGYSEAMIVFTKVLKPLFSAPRKQGYFSVAYVDDSFLQGDNFDACLNDVKATLQLLQTLGFTIHLKKSSLVPSQHIELLGFIINSLNMTLELASHKKQKHLALCHELMSRKCNIRNLASFIGNLVASFLTVPYGPPLYRSLERDKHHSLVVAKWKFDQPAILSNNSLQVTGGL